MKSIFLLTAPLLCTSAVLLGQGGGVSPADLLKPLKDSWPTYNGDYSGKRYSALTQVNTTTVKNLSLAWMIRLSPGPGNPGGGPRFGRGGGAPAAPVIVGGEGT